MKRLGLPLLIVIFFAVSLLGYPRFAGADASATTDTTVASLQAQIAAYQKQLDALSSQKSTLQSVISSLSISQQQLAAQIKVTQANIASANKQIAALSGSISDKEATITADQDAIAKTLRGVAEGEETPLVAQILSSDSLREAWQTADVALQFNRAIASDIRELKDTRTALMADRDQATKAKADLVALQTQLSAQNRSIAAKKAQQQQLLADTKNSEANYQKLLAAAKAELASFSAFTTAAGGSKLLANQTSCDTWGCYYNQRDTAWGNLPLNGTQYRLASDGCLVTSMAMVLTHYGYRDVTPVTINSNPDNFAAYYPALLLFTTYFDGTSARRVAAYLDATLAGGNPVIVGVHAYGGTHFVVLVSGRGGSYVMRDPYIANGKDIKFSDHYTLRSVYAVNKVIING